MTSALFLFISALSPSASPADERLEWIWSSRERNTPAVRVFRNVFPVRSIEASAELFGVADCCAVTVYLNGKRVGSVPDYSPAFRFDVTKLLQPGDNLLAVHAKTVGGPAAIALRITEGKTVYCRTNESWQVSEALAEGWNRTTTSAGKWSPAVSFGALEDLPWLVPPAAIEITPFDDYTQWMRALGAESSGTQPSFDVPTGFAVELVRSAASNEGSWVSLAFDPKGRVVLAREDKGLLRLTLAETRKDQRIDTINDSLLECRGLLFAHGALYANANNAKALYRLRDKDGDDRYEEVTELKATAGGVGHGRNDLALGPDGLIYSIHGDDIRVPDGSILRTSPAKGLTPGEDRSHGHVIRTDSDGKRWEVVASGLRNPFGIDFNLDGEMFTYDADAEHDMGAPWYRPTRVRHLVSGADFGWRNVTAIWPPYYPDSPDSPAPTLDIGKGSPTSVSFGTRSNYPERWRRALFILDWAYGRIVAVHMAPRGASYTCSAETFVRGRPLNVTDLTFGTDGSMYFVTGGRKTQSALYRVRYIGPKQDEPVPSIQQKERIEHAAKARSLRRALEAYHGKQEPKAVEAAWPHLASADPMIRHAARVAIEHQPADSWSRRALAERSAARLEAGLALARVGAGAELPVLLDQLSTQDVSEWPAERLSLLLRVYELALHRTGSLPSSTKDRVLRQLTTPSIGNDNTTYRRAMQLLVELDAPDLAPTLLAHFARAATQEDRMQDLFVLREVKSGWSVQSRRSYFHSLRDAQQTYRGGAGMPTFLKQIADDALANVPPDQAAELRAILNTTAAPSDTVNAPADTRPLVKKWTADDLLANLEKPGDARRGRAVFDAALCSRCHRLADQGYSYGPELTFVAARFGRRDLIESILDPSKVVAENYRNVSLVLKDGRTLVGRVVTEGDFRAGELQIAPDALLPHKLTTIAKRDIESYRPLATSPMPTGLLDTFTPDEIRDLFAYLESGGVRTGPGTARAK